MNPITQRKNPADSTRRNVQASAKRDKKLEEELRDVKRRLKHIEKVIYEQLGIDLRDLQKIQR